MVKFMTQKEYNEFDPIYRDSFNNPKTLYPRQAYKQEAAKAIQITNKEGKGNKDSQGKSDRRARKSNRVK